MAKSKKNVTVVETPADVVHNAITEIILSESPVTLVAPVAIPVTDTLSDILGTGGEVTMPYLASGMVDKFNLTAMVKAALDTNVNMSRDDVLTYIEDRTGKTLGTDFPDSTFTNSLSVTRKKLRTVDQAIAKEEKGIDPVTVLKLCQLLNMPPTKLSAVLAEIKEVGSLDAIQVGLVKLAELQELLGIGK